MQIYEGLYLDYNLLDCKSDHKKGYEAASPAPFPSWGPCLRSDLHSTVSQSIVQLIAGMMRLWARRRSEDRQHQCPGHSLF